MGFWNFSKVHLMCTSGHPGASQQNACQVWRALRPPRQSINQTFLHIHTFLPHSISNRWLAYQAIYKQICISCVCDVRTDNHMPTESYTMHQILIVNLNGAHSSEPIISSVLQHLLNAKKVQGDNNTVLAYNKRQGKVWSSSLWKG